MKISIFNSSNLDMGQMKPLLSSFLPFAKKKIGFDKPVDLSFASDPENASLPLGKTAHYDPITLKITIFTDNRHIKDVLRSLAHELVHHKQNCCGQFADFGNAEDGYAQNDPHLRSMEEEAYLVGNMCFRDWEDTHKKQLQESIYYNQLILAGDNKMNTKDWKDLEMNKLLMERWGYEAPINEEDPPPTTGAEMSVEDAMNLSGRQTDSIYTADAPYPSLEQGGIDPNSPAVTGVSSVEELPITAPSEVPPGEQPDRWLVDIGEAPGRRGDAGDEVRLDRARGPLGEAAIRKAIRRALINKLGK